MRYTTEQLMSLIPQRAPMLMLDSIESIEGEDTITSLFTIREGNIFLVDNTLQEMALIENQAQTASALAGHKALGSTESAPIGMIGEVKNFALHSLPHMGDTLRTTVTFLNEVAGVTLIRCNTHVGDTLVAETQMKIFVE